MMVPRSFLYSSPPPQKTKNTPKKPEVRTEPKAPKMEKRAPPREQRAQPPSEVRNLPTRTVTTPSLVPSRPVVIPPRSHSIGFQETRRLNTQSQGAPKSARRAGDLHKPGAIPPSVAALLAITSIPPPSKGNSLRRKSNQNETHKSLMALLEEPPLLEGEDLTSPNDKSPMDMLLGLPEGPEDDGNSTTGDSVSDRVLSIRSVSSESMPSLEGDDESTASMNTPPTPVPVGRRTSADRKGKMVSSPPAEDCASDHPLLYSNFDVVTPEIGDSAGDAELLTPTYTSLPTRSKSAFKSNLTASLRVLKSAARSLSNFTAPVVQPDDFLTRSILSISPQYTDERRPLNLGDTPAPALRRYLNPLTSSAPELDVQHRASANKEQCTAMIQMQTYQRSKRTAKKDSSPIVKEDNTFPEAGPVARQREPRENSDFLRVIVLEMNMRREGKLSDSAQGKARIWLPPRRPGKKQATEDGGVPTRWVGMLLEP